MAPVSLYHPALMLDVCYPLECDAMRLEAREMSANARRDIIDLAESGVRDHDRDERRPIQHGELYAAYRFPGWVPHRYKAQLVLYPEIQNAPREARGARNSLPTALTQHHKPTQRDDSV
jgi:hypothetical protein